MGGHLQSNKVSALVRGCSSLTCLETIDREKLARAVNKAWIAVHGQDRKLRVMVQVNTSGEATKNGVEPADAVALCRVVATECEGLELAGLMNWCPGLQWLPRRRLSSVTPLLFGGSGTAGFGSCKPGAQHGHEHRLPVGHPRGFYISSRGVNNFRCSALPVKDLRSINV